MQYYIGNSISVGGHGGGHIEKYESWYNRVVDGDDNSSAANGGTSFSVGSYLPPWV